MNKIIELLLYNPLFWIGLAFLCMFLFPGVFKSDKTAGYGIGALTSMIFTPYILSMADGNGFSWKIVMLTYVFIIGINGLLYPIFPTWEESRGDKSFRKSLKYLKWFGILVLAMALGIAWFLHIGPPALLFFTTMILIYLIAPQAIERVLDRLKMKK